VAISFFIDEVIKKYLIKDLKDQYSESCGNKEILRDIKKDVEKVELIKYLFKEEENI
jgi:hypothetical protein